MKQIVSNHFICHLNNLGYLFDIHIEIHFIVFLADDFALLKVEM